MGIGLYNFLKENKGLLKYIVMGSSVLILILTVILAIYGIFKAPEESKYEILVNVTGLRTQVWVIIASILLVSAVGLSIYGTYKEYLKVIFVYFLVQTASFAFVEVVGIGQLRGAPEVKVRQHMESTMSSFAQLSRQWGEMQRSLKCCGTYSPKDWFPVIGHQSLPSSCCRTVTVPLGDDALCLYAPDPNVVYQSGCFDKAFEKVGKTAHTPLLRIVITLQILQLFNAASGATFAYVVWKNDKS